MMKQVRTIHARTLSLLFALAMVGCAFLSGHSDAPQGGTDVADADTHKLGSSVPWGGDFAGSTNVSGHIAALQGKTLTIGTPNTGNTIGWNGSAFVPGALNLGGGSNYVSGSLPLANITVGTAGQILVTNSTATAPAWASCSGDIACSTATVGQMAVQSITPTGGTAAIVPFNAGGLKLSTTPWVLQDSTGVTRDSFDTTHGRITAGGGGSDNYITIGPMAGSETTATQLRAVGYSSAVVNMLSDSGGSLLVGSTTSGDTSALNATVGGYQFAQIYCTQGAGSYLSLAGNILQTAGVTLFGLGGGSSAAPVEINISTATAPYIQSGTSATSLGVGTNKAAAIMNIQGGQAVTGISVTAAGSTPGTASTTLTGAWTVTVRSTSTTDTMDSSGPLDHVVATNTTTAAYTETLPVAAVGRHIVVLDAAGSWQLHNLTIAGNGTNTVNGAASVAKAGNWEVVECYGISTTGWVCY
ncbi:MAG: hypothetical protein ACYCPT_02085 [Acidimicrobiales bacterium]